jgi:hypothetical protein
VRARGPEKKILFATQTMASGPVGRSAHVVPRVLNGEDVMPSLREQCKTPAALATALTRIRKLVFAALPVPDCRTLEPYALEPGVAAFLAAPLAERVRVQREHVSRPTWSVGAEAALAVLQLVPPNVESLRLDRHELVAYKRDRADSLFVKQERLIRVPNAATLLAQIVEMARTSVPKMTYTRLAIPLMLLSGRRTTEIMNGLSAFEKVGATTCTFTGQLKKRGVASEPYVIPLLCDYGVFAHALRALRAKQRHVTLDAAKCNSRYHRRLNIAARSLFPVTHPAHLRTCHELRAMYAAYAYHMYEHSVTFNYFACWALGHESIQVSLSYNNVALYDAGAPGVLGAPPYMTSSGEGA